jgi:hypothetical protein
MAETELQMAWRHVVRGQQLIIRQQSLLAGLEQGGSEDLIATARATLDIMMSLQNSFEAHLAELEEERWRIFA